MPFSEEMPKYQCHKTVRALKIKDVERGSITLLRFANHEPIYVSYSFDEKHHPEAGGYYVVYEDGYQSFSPAGAFESGYSLVVEG